MTYLNGHLTYVSCLSQTQIRLPCRYKSSGIKTVHWECTMKSRNVGKRREKKSPYFNDGYNYTYLCQCHKAPHLHWSNTPLHCFRSPKLPAYTQGPRPCDLISRGRSWKECCQNNNNKPKASFSANPNVYSDHVFA